MKPLGFLLKEALGSRSVAWYRDFTLILVAGFAIFFGVLFGIGADSVRAPFDLKVATGCLVLAAVCVLLASNRILVLSCAVMVPAALAGFHAGVTGNRKAVAFCSLSVGAGFLILLLGTLLESLWQAWLARRIK